MTRRSREVPLPNGSARRRKSSGRDASMVVETHRGEETKSKGGEAGGGEKATRWRTNFVPEIRKSFEKSEIERGRTEERRRRTNEWKRRRVARTAPTERIRYPNKARLHFTRFFFPRQSTFGSSSSSSSSPPPSPLRTRCRISGILFPVTSPLSFIPSTRLTKNARRPTKSNDDTVRPHRFHSSSAKETRTIIARSDRKERHTVHVRYLGQLSGRVASQRRANMRIRGFVDPSQSRIFVAERQKTPFVRRVPKTGPRTNAWGFEG